MDHKVPAHIFDAICHPPHISSVRDALQVRHEIEPHGSDAAFVQATELSIGYGRFYDGCTAILAAGMCDGIKGCVHVRAMAGRVDDHGTINP